MGRRAWATVMDQLLRRPVGVGSDTNNPPGPEAITWLLSDFIADGVHPNAAGIRKTSAALMSFFLNSPYPPWFRA